MTAAARAVCSFPRRCTPRESPARERSERTSCSPLLPPVQVPLLPPCLPLPPDLRAHAPAAKGELRPMAHLRPLGRARRVRLVERERHHLWERGVGADLLERWPLETRSLQLALAQRCGCACWSQNGARLDSAVRRILRVGPLVSWTGYLGRWCETVLSGTSLCRGIGTTCCWANWEGDGADPERRRGLVVRPSSRCPNRGDGLAGVSDVYHGLCLCPWTARRRTDVKRRRWDGEGGEARTGDGEDGSARDGL